MGDGNYNDHKDVGAGHCEGLRESGKRTLMRTILLATGLTLGGFSILQALAGNYPFAIIDVNFNFISFIIDVNVNFVSFVANNN